MSDKYAVRYRIIGKHEGRILQFDNITKHIFDTEMSRIYYGVSTKVEVERMKIRRPENGFVINDRLIEIRKMKNGKEYLYEGRYRIGEWTYYEWGTGTAPYIAEKNLLERIPTIDQRYHNYFIKFFSIFLIICTLSGLSKLSSKKIDAVYDYQDSYCVSIGNDLSITLKDNLEEIPKGAIEVGEFLILPFSESSISLRVREPLSFSFSSVKPGYPRLDKEGYVTGIKSKLTGDVIPITEEVVVKCEDYL